MKTASRKFPSVLRLLSLVPSAKVVMSSATEFTMYLCWVTKGIGNSQCLLGELSNFPEQQLAETPQALYGNFCLVIHFFCEHSEDFQLQVLLLNTKVNRVMFSGVIVLNILQPESTDRLNILHYSSVKANEF